MGCSAGLGAIGLAKQLLQVHQSTCALIVSTEITARDVYHGTDRQKIITNCIFRSGGSAVLLSNKPTHRKNSKFELMHTVHTQTASSDVSYQSIYREEDSDGHTGLTINKNLIVAAALTIEQHLKILGHELILPDLSERFLFGLKLGEDKPSYNIPKFNKCAEHFLPHVGGKPVLAELQRNLGFSDGDMEASIMTLHRFGNTSSSSIWYELAYAEAKRRIRKGDRVWQIAYGSGFKCSSVIWRALKNVEIDEKNPWMTDIDDYPLDPGTSSPPPNFFEPSKQQ